MLNSGCMQDSCTAGCLHHGEHAFMHLCTQAVESILLNSWLAVRWCRRAFACQVFLADEVRTSFQTQCSPHTTCVVQDRKVIVLTSCEVVHQLCLQVQLGHAPQSPALDHTLVTRSSVTVLFCTGCDWPKAVLHGQLSSKPSAKCRPPFHSVIGALLPCFHVLVAGTVTLLLALQHR